MIESRVKCKYFLKRLCLPTPKPTEVACAASLAHHGLLGRLSELSLCNENLSLVPADHLASLASCVRLNVFIRDVYVSNCDLVPILDSLQCHMLSIARQSLSTEETQALVRAMETRVHTVVLGSDHFFAGSSNGDVNLDIEVLTTYSGEGKCSAVSCQDNTGARYNDDLRIWINKTCRKKTGEQMQEKCESREWTEETYTLGDIFFVRKDS